MHLLQKFQKITIQSFFGWKKKRHAIDEQVLAVQHDTTVNNSHFFSTNSGGDFKSKNQRSNWNCQSPVFFFFFGVSLTPTRFQSPLFRRNPPVSWRTNKSPRVPHRGRNTTLCSTNLLLVESYIRA